VLAPKKATKEKGKHNFVEMYNYLLQLRKEQALV